MGNIIIKYDKNREKLLNYSVDNELPIISAINSCDVKKFKFLIDYGSKMNFTDEEIIEIEKKYNIII